MAIVDGVQAATPGDHIRTEALVLNGLGEEFKLEHVAVEYPSKDEVLVKIVASGICHTDVIIGQGALPSPFPTILGHEGAGEVVCVGDGVEGLAPGDKVLLSFASCNACGFCQSKCPAGCVAFNDVNFARCRSAELKDKPGYVKLNDDGTAGASITGAFFGQSSFAKLALANKLSCVKVDPGTDLATMAPLGCGYQTGAGTVLNVLAPAKPKSIAVFGLGAVGMGALLAAGSINMPVIVAVDLLDSKLELAKQLGATHIVNARDADAVEQIRKASGGWCYGVDCAVEASGSPRALKTAYDALTNFGHVVSCGNPGPGVPTPIEIHDAVSGSKKWSGIAEGMSYPPVFLPHLMRLHAEGLFSVDKLQKSYPFTAEGFKAATDDMHRGLVVKPVLVVA